MPDDPADDEYDSVQRIEELQVGASLDINCKRGTDVRDDDSVSISANFETIEDLRDGSEELADIVIERMAELRAFKPDADTEE